jgi:hypothetical protein
MLLVSRAVRPLGAGHAALVYYHRRMSTTNHSLLACLCAVAACASRGNATSSSRDFAQTLADALAKECGAARADDLAARDACADALGAHPLLRDHSADVILWGAQSPGAGYDVARSKTTEFNPLAFRRSYLATFSFSGAHRVVEERDGLVVLHAAVRFRNGLEAGAYPYPFWHAAPKWLSYQRCEELLFFIRDERLVAVLRSEEQDPARPLSERVWDGQWTWQSTTGAPEPHSSLFSYVLAPDNPHLGRLEDAYREFATAEREADCTSCHSPENPAAENPLYLLTYPGQALAARAQLVAHLEANTMPPAEGQRAPGLSSEPLRLRLLELARAFRDAADDALAHEGEL